MIKEFLRVPIRVAPNTDIMRYIDHVSGKGRVYARASCWMDLWHDSKGTLQIIMYLLGEEKAISASQYGVVVGASHGYFWFESGKWNSKSHPVPYRWWSFRNFKITARTVKKLPNLYTRKYFIKGYLNEKISNFTHSILRIFNVFNIKK